MLTASPNRVVTVSYTHLIGGGIGIGIATGKATEAISRQPEASGKIQTNLLLGAALAEGTAIFGFVVAPVSYTHLDVYKRQAQHSAATLPRGRRGTRLCSSTLPSRTRKLPSMNRTPAKQKMEAVLPESMENSR